MISFHHGLAFATITHMHPSGGRQFALKLLLLGNGQQVLLIMLLPDYEYDNNYVLTSLIQSMIIMNIRLGSLIFCRMAATIQVWVKVERQDRQPFVMDIAGNVLVSELVQKVLTEENLDQIAHDKIAIHDKDGSEVSPAAKVSGLTCGGDAENPLCLDLPDDNGETMHGICSFICIYTTKIIRHDSDV